jgi:hypothetical protein
MGDAAVPLCEESLEVALAAWSYGHLGDIVILSSTCAPRRRSALI